jgi:hypothetical protein
MTRENRVTSNIIIRPCHGSGGQSPASHRRGPASNPAQSTWDVVDKVALLQVSSEICFPVSIIPPLLSILTYNLRDERWVHLWPQFRDIISPHRQEQQQKLYNLHSLPNGTVIK